MNKKAICLVCALLLAISFSACGQERMTGGRDANGVDILPETSPMVSPDWNDGVVRDQDGIIGNGDGASVSPNPGASTAPGASPAPGVSPAPSASPSPSVMPTTAPESSPKP